MAPHSSSLAWKTPWTEEPGGLQSMGSLRVGHDWVTSLSLFTSMHWRRKWQPTLILLPGESQGRGSLVGCRLWRHTESDTTEATQQQQQQYQIKQNKFILAGKRHNNKQTKKGNSVRLKARMEEPGRLWSVGSLRVGHQWATSLSLFTSMHWRRKWHPTPVFLPEESQGRGSLVGCRLWGHTELDTTEVT